MYHNIFVGSLTALVALTEVLLDSGSLGHSLVYFFINFSLFLQVFRLLHTQRSTLVANHAANELLSCSSRVVEEKRLLTEIISVSKCIHSETALIEKLFDLIIQNAEQLNIIHIATVCHKLSQVKLLHKAKSFERWKVLAERAKEFLLKETNEGLQNLKTALTLILTLSKIIKNEDDGWMKIVDNFITSNIDSLDHVALAQLTSCFAGMTSMRASHLVVRRFAESGLMSQADLVHYLTKAEQKCDLIDLIVHVKRFVPKSLNFLVSFIERNCEIDLKKRFKALIANRFELEQVNNCSPHDLVASYSICSETVRAALEPRLIDTFFDLPIHFVKDTLVSKAGRCAKFETVVSHYIHSTDNSIKLDHLRLALTALFAAGTVPSRKIIDGIYVRITECDPALTKNYVDLVVLLGNMDEKFTLFFESRKRRSGTSADPSVAIGALLLNLEAPELHAPRIKMSLSDQLLLAASKRISLKRIQSLDRFVITSVIEALCIVRLNDSKRIAKALKFIDKSSFAIDAVTFALTLFTCKDLSSCSVISRFLIRQVPACCSSVLSKMVNVSELREASLAELSSRLSNGQVNLNTVIAIIATFTGTGVHPSQFDPFFKALQEWLIPQIPKLRVEEVADITKALELFEKRASLFSADEINTP